jgi:hypothetical protein
MRERIGDHLLESERSVMQQPNDPNLNDLLVRTDEANLFVSCVEDDIVRNLLRVALSQVALRVRLRCPRSDSAFPEHRRS